MQAEARFAEFIAILGRGPGRSRALERHEAREAFAMVLAGAPDPVQIGAFLMLLRYRGEDADEVSGLVEAARAIARINQPGVDLDWPSYGAGRTRAAPWFLLAALALARAGIRVLMHGSNEFAQGISVAEGLALLGFSPAADPAEAARQLASDRFAYLPIAALAPPLARLLEYRRLFGLRSPVNTVARLLDPADAGASIDGVFHPPYIETHLGVAERLARPRLLVLKGGGGEAERNPARPTRLHLWLQATGRQELELPSLLPPSLLPPGQAEAIAGDASLGAVWRGEAAPVSVISRITGTIALGLLACGKASAAEADAAALQIWRAR